MPGRGTRAAALRAVGANMRQGVWLSLIFAQSREARAALGDERYLAFSAAFGSVLGWRLRRAFDATFLRALGDDLALHAWNTVERTLECHVGLVLADDPAGAAALAPLVELLPDAVPLCPATDDPRTWLVLVR
jgi:hypothetical protein